LLSALHTNSFEKIICMRHIIVLFCIACFLCKVQAQNVGIGTNTPTEKLQVAGNIKADTVKPNAFKLSPDAGTGKILTSDATGNASWQTASGSNSASAGNAGFGVWGDCATNGNISEYNPVANEVGANASKFGSSVCVSGNYAIIGAPGGTTTNGSASIYQYTGINWVLMQIMNDATGAPGDWFGFSVSISGDYAIVGAPYDNNGGNTNQGSVSIYHYNGTAWVLMDKIIDNAAGTAGDQFGYSVSISGTFAIAGTPYDVAGGNQPRGTASIYQYNGTNWVLMNKIVDVTGGSGDQFGNSVSISGSYAVIGASRDDVLLNADQGSASIYQYNGSNWVLMQKLTDADGSANDYFGGSVSISGNYIIAGANNDAAGSNTSQGSASIYQYNSGGGSWLLMQKLTDANGAVNDLFGNSVSISDSYAIVGATGDDVAANGSQGSATVFIKLGQKWQRLQYITDPAGEANDGSGKSVSVDKATKRFLIGNLVEKAMFGKIN
jgi:hypothetical protein